MPLKMLMILETPSVGSTSFIIYQVWYLLKEATPLCSSRCILLKNLHYMFMPIISVLWALIAFFMGMRTFFNQ